MIWLSDLVAGRDGKPDEAALGFLIGLTVGTILTVLSFFMPTHRFSMMDYCGGLGALLALYNASKGVRNKLGGS